MIEVLLILLLLTLTAIVLATPYLYKQSSMRPQEEREDPLFFKLFQLKSLSLDVAAGKIDKNEYLLLKTTLERECLQLIRDQETMQQQLHDHAQKILQKEWLCSNCFTFNSKTMKSCRCGAPKK